MKLRATLKRLTTILFLISFFSCNEQPANNKIIAFSNDPVLSFSNGNPKDSLAFYFPSKLFYDTLKHYVYHEDTFQFQANQNIDTIIKLQNMTKTEFKVLDSVEIEDVSWMAKIWSFSLFKMNEPILYNYNLNKEYYRLMIGRSMSKFFIISIVKDQDSIYMITRGLNRQVGYPIMKYLVSNIVFQAPGSKELSDDEAAIKKQEQDSIALIHNNTNYFIDSLIVKRISEEQWIEFQNKLDKVKYWDSYPISCGGCQQIDGSRWVIEGQSDKGYQFHEILSPFRKYKPKKDYDALFRFIVKTSGLDQGQFEYY